MQNSFIIAKYFELKMLFHSSFSSSSYFIALYPQVLYFSAN